MIELLNLLSVVIPYVLSVPLSLYIGGVFENMKNYTYYKKSVKLKKKDDDYDINNEQDSPTIQKKPNSMSGNIDNSKNNNNNYNNKIIKKITFKDCFSFKISTLNPSILYIYYTRFSMYFIFLIFILTIPRKVVPEIYDIFTVKFWLPSALTIKNSIIGFIVTIVFGQPWLDNPIIQIQSLNKFLYTPPKHCSRHFNKKFIKQSQEQQKQKQNYSSYEKSSSQLNMEKSNEIKNRTGSSSDPLNGNLSWNPEQHFNNKLKANLVDISRLLCSCFIIPVIEELMFRYIFYRFIIGGFNYKLVSFSTWKWTAAILSNITITHIFYIRCYEKGQAWISGLINGYLCTYSMVKQGHWNASVTTRSLTNLYIGLFVLITKKYKYWY